MSEPDPFRPLDAITAALAAADAVDLDGLPERDLSALVNGLGRVGRQVAARRLAAVAELDRRRRDNGDPTGRATRDLLTNNGLTPGRARRDIDTANALADLPTTRQALADGEISPDHAEQIAKAARRLDDPADQQRIDATGAAKAKACDPRQLRKILDKAVTDLEPEDLEDREARAIRNRTVTTFDTDDGMVAIRGKLPRHHGEAVRTALSSLSRPHGADDDRTFEQRQADALTKLATDHLDRGEGGEEGGYVPHISLVVDLPDTPENEEEGEGAPVTGDLAHSGPVSERMVKRLGCDATVARIITNGPGRVLDVGRAHRTATTAQRRALAARDRGCIGCGAPPGWCQAHHMTFAGLRPTPEVTLRFGSLPASGPLPNTRVQWWRHGGRTDMSNLALVCWSCHDKIHHLDWQVETQPDGRYTLTPPGAEGGQTRLNPAA